VEGPRELHRRDLAHGDTVVDVDDVRPVRGVGVRVGRCPTDGQDLADVVHHGVAIHGVAVVPAHAGRAEAAASNRVEPVELPTWTGVENPAFFHEKSQA